MHSGQDSSIAILIPKFRETIKYNKSFSFIMAPGLHIFEAIQGIFGKHRPSPELKKEYELMEQVGLYLANELLTLKKLYRSLILHHRGHPDLAFGKTLYVEEGLAPELVELAKLAKERLIRAEESLSSREPLTQIEKDQIQQILGFFEKVMSETPNLKEIEKESEKDKLKILESALRNVERMTKEYWVARRMEKRLARSLFLHQVGPAVRKVFKECKVEEFGESGKKIRVLAIRLSPAERSKFEEEAENINVCQDPKYAVSWRDWWRRHHPLEKDKGQPLPPHINVGVTLNGKHKEIHILQEAA